MKTIPAVEVASIPSRLPTEFKGLSNTFVRMESTGKVPSRTTPMLPMIASASEMGDIPGISTTPVIASKAAAASPTVMTQTMKFPNQMHPLII